MDIQIESEKATIALGEKIAALLVGGEVLELVGDVGAGKTFLTKSIARGLGITEDVQSPTFTISRLYDTPRGLQLAHYDFYRLNDAGIMALELAETLSEPKTVTVLEWSEVVAGVLPKDRLTITFSPVAETSRRLQLVAGGPKSQAIVEQLA